jgi:hypothetical protein
VDHPGDAPAEAGVRPIRARSFLASSFRRNTSAKNAAASLGVANARAGTTWAMIEVGINKM